jgi:hypothetical protein
VTDPDAASVRDLERVLAETATGLWRLADRLANQSTVDNDAEGSRWRSAHRQLERIVETLTDSGIRVEDHRGRPFHPGLPLEVVAYQPTPGLRQETVIDVERPSVYRGATLIQRARVVVGTPQSDVPDA